MNGSKRAASEATPTDPPTPTRWQVGALRTSIQILLALAALVAALWILYRVEGVLLVLSMSILFAYLVAPVVGFFRRPIPFRGVGRVMPMPIAIGAAYVLIFGTLAGAIYLLMPVLNAQLAEFRGELPGYVMRLEAGWQAWLKGQTRALPRDLRVAIDALVVQASNGITHYVQADLLPRVGRWLMHLPWLILVPILAFFLLKDADQFRQAALGLFPGRKLRWRGDVFFGDVNRTLAAYIRSQLLSSLVVAVVCTAGFFWIGVPYGVVLGIAAGLLEFIPLAGPLAIAVSAVGLAAMESPARAATVALFLIVVRILQDYVINPKLVGREIPLHPMAVILAILCGGEIGGLAGVFLAVPVLAILTVAYRHWRAHRDAEVPRPVVL
jgi:predicted PurR-regulated permease PerM